MQATSVQSYHVDTHFDQPVNPSSCTKNIHREQRILIESIILHHSLTMFVGARGRESCGNAGKMPSIPKATVSTSTGIQFLATDGVGGNTAGDDDSADEDPVPSPVPSLTPTTAGIASSPTPNTAGMP